MNAVQIAAVFDRASASYPLPICGDRSWIERVHPVVWQDMCAKVQSGVAAGVTELRARDILAFSRSGDRDLFQDAHHRRRQELVCLTAALARDCAEPGIDAIADRDVLVDCIQDRVWAICEESSWILSAHLWNNGLSSELPPPDIHMIDLAAAQTALTLCEVLHIANEQLHPEIRDRVDHELEHRIFRPYLYRNNFHWMTSYHNWNIVCHSGIAIAALYRGGERYRSAIIAKVLQFAGRYIDGHDEEGATPEGIMVWNYGFGHLCMLNEHLERWSNGELSLFQACEAKIREIALFPQKLHMSGEQFVNFSDCDRTTRLSPFIFSYLHDRLGFDLSLPPYTGLKEHDYIFRLLFMPEHSHAPWMSTHPLSTFFEGNQWLVARSDSGPGPRVTIATKGGNNGESHNHNDLGTFIIHAGGESLIADLGRDRFTRQTFAGDRYAALAYSSRGHSVPRLNGVHQSAGEQFRSQVLLYEPGERERITYDLTAAYPSEARCTSLQRTFVYRRADNVLEVHDRFAMEASSGTVPIEEVFWSFLPFTVVSDTVFEVSGSGVSVQGEFERAPHALSVDKHTEAVQGQTAWCIRARYDCAAGMSLTTVFRVQFEKEKSA